MRKELIQLAIALITVALLIVGRPVSFPDNVHTVHGLPLTWGVHQLVTIVGPVDNWRVNLVNLVIDLMIWFGAVIVAPKMLRKKEA